MAAESNPDDQPSASERYRLVPTELRRRGQWICWETGERNSKATKIPREANGTGYAKADDLATWAPFDTAVEGERAHGYAGIGFVFSTADDYLGIDVDVPDNDPEGDSWVPDLSLLEGCYTERSPSGSGLHPILKGVSIPEWWTNQAIDAPDGSASREIAAYSEGRYFTVTGDAEEFTDDSNTPAVLDESDQARFEEWLQRAWWVFNPMPDADEWDAEHPDEDYPTSDEWVPWIDTSSGGAGSASASGSGGSTAASGEPVDLDVYDLIARSQYPAGERCEHPVHNSSTGANFLVDEDGETFRCWRHGVTGHAGYLLGMLVGEIECGEWVPDGLDAQTWRSIYDAAREQGYDVPDAPTAHSEAKATSNDPGEQAAATSTSADAASESAAEDVPVAEVGPSYEDGDQARGDHWGDVRDSFISTEAGSHGRALQNAATEVRRETPVITEVTHEGKMNDVFCYDSGTGVYRRGSAPIQNRLASALGTEYRVNRENEIMAVVKRLTQVPIDDIGGPDGAVCVQNGVLDISTPDDVTLGEHDPAFRFVRGIPTVYEPEAECPEFEEFLGSVVTEENAATLQEYVGYCLHHWGQPHKRAALLLGPKDSGKSTFLTIVKELIGQRNVSAENLDSLVNSRWGKAELQGKLANISNELETHTLESVGLFKSIVGGGDPVSAERKGENKFQFDPTAKHLFATNRVPPANDADDAFHERWLHIMFPETIPRSQQDRDLADRIIENELPGILNWALEGYARLQREGGFTHDPHVVDKRDQWEAYGDTIKRFKQSCLKVTGSPEDVIVKPVAHALYARFAAEHVGAEVETQTKLTRELKTDGQITDGRRKVKPNGRQWTAYVGVKFNGNALDELGFDPGAMLDDLREREDDGEDAEEQTREPMGGLGAYEEDDEDDDSEGDGSNGGESGEPMTDGGVDVQPAGEDESTERETAVRRVLD